MARPRKPISAPSLNPGQASYVLDRLVNERLVSPADINRYVDEMRREITDLESRLERLRAAHGGGGTESSGGGAAAPARRPGRPPGRRPGRPGRPPGRPGRPGRPPGRPKGSGANAGGAAGGGEAAAAGSGGEKRGRKRRARSAITAEQLASRQLQGRYLALVRQFPENRRTSYAKIAKEKGREAAIKDMQDALKK